MGGPAWPGLLIVPGRPVGLGMTYMLLMQAVSGPSARQTKQVERPDQTYTKIPSVDSEKYKEFF
jgi:hypothetical protein